MNKQLVTFIVAACLSGCGVNSPPPVVAKPAVDYYPEAIQFRIVARRERHRREIDLATAQQEAEDKAGREWSEVVLSDVAPNKPVAQWFNIHKDRESNFSEFDGTIRTLPPQPDGTKAVQLLVVNDPMQVNRSHIDHAAPGLDQGGNPCVVFAMTAEGAKRMLLLTSMSLPDPDGSTYCLAIILDGIVMSAPTIRGAISDRGEITGRFTREEVEDLAAILNAIKLNGAPAAPSSR